MGLKEAHAALLQGLIHDDAGRLKRGGRKQLGTAIDTRLKGGLRARVVILAKDADLKPYRTLWAQLRLDPKSDLLLVSSGRRWEAKGWGLEPAQIARALDAAEPELKRYLAAGLVAALDNLEAAAAPKTSAPASGLLGTTGFAIGGGVLLLGGLGWVITRRQKRSAGTTRRYLEAFEGADRIFADLMVEGDALEDGDDILRDAGQLKGELDRIDREARGNARAMADPVTIGRLEQVGNHLSALRTRLLQRGG